MSFRLSLLPLTFLSACFWAACAPHGGADAKAPTIAELRRHAVRLDVVPTVW